MVWESGGHAVCGSRELERNRSAHRPSVVVLADHQPPCTHYERYRRVSRRRQEELEEAVEWHRSDGRKAGRTLGGLMRGWVEGGEVLWCGRREDFEAESKRESRAASRSFLAPQPLLSFADVQHLHTASVPPHLPSRLCPPTSNPPLPVRALLISPASPSFKTPSEAWYAGQSGNGSTWSRCSIAFCSQGERRAALVSLPLPPSLSAVLPRTACATDSQIPEHWPAIYRSAPLLPSSLRRFRRFLVVVVTVSNWLVPPDPSPRHQHRFSTHFRAPVFSPASSCTSARRSKGAHRPCAAARYVLVTAVQHRALWASKQLLEVHWRRTSQKGAV